ncbi:MAG: arcadin 1 [Candidatus Methylarchaceae archaeon HK01M]|nr:arcadin 1 [Candidatus Methylarchaceae archaeon HK01M]
MTKESYPRKYVRVQRITSINDPATGLPGKRIELVEVRPRKSNVLPVSGEEARLVQGILSQFQSLGMLPHIKEIVSPKLTILLTEDEYDRLGIRFEVNDTYELILKDGMISLKSSKEGV